MRSWQTVLNIPPQISLTVKKSAFYSYHWRFLGDEGKGKIISYLALEDELDVCVRTGSVNAAHTVCYQGESHALHIFPQPS